MREGLDKPRAIVERENDEHNENASKMRRSRLAGQQISLARRGFEAPTAYRLCPRECGRAMLAKNNSVCRLARA